MRNTSLKQQENEMSHGQPYTEFLGVYLPLWLKEAVEELAHKRGCTTSECVRRCLVYGILVLTKMREKEDEIVGAIASNVGKG